MAPPNDARMLLDRYDMPLGVIGLPWPVPRSIEFLDSGRAGLLIAEAGLDGIPRGLVGPIQLVWRDVGDVGWCNMMF